MGTGKEGSETHVFSLFTSSPPPPHAYFSIIAIVLGYPAVASAEERERETDQMVVSRHRKIDVKLLNKATEDAQDDHAVVFNTSKVTKLICSIVF